MKSSLYSLSVLRVSGAQSVALRQGPHIKVAVVVNRWQRVGE